MKKINITQLRKQLNDQSNDDAKKTIILNNAELYNDLIADYKEDKDKKNLYIIYQLNGMLLKQIVELEKNTPSSKDKDTFTDFIDKFKDKIEKR